jgi:uncharacterized protein (TIGR03000 family)
MYSVVLMMAISGSADAPDCLFRNRCGHCGHSHSWCHRERHHRCGHYRSHCGGWHHSYCGHNGHNGHYYYDGGVGPAPAPAPLPAPKKTEEVAIPATIVVTLPADAKLTIDGNATTSRSARRIFTSPALEQGQEYVYTLRAEIVREGQMIAETQNITVRAGAEIPVQFMFNSQGVATR